MKKYYQNIKSIIKKKYLNVYVYHRPKRIVIVRHGEQHTISYEAYQNAFEFVIVEKITITGETDEHVLKGTYYLH